MAVARCTSATIDPADATRAIGDPTETALLIAARRLGADVATATRERGCRAVFRFDPALTLMSTVDEVSSQLWVHTKGSPEAVLARCTTLLMSAGAVVPFDDAARATVEDEVTSRGVSSASSIHPDPRSPGRSSCATMPASG
jgi:magnesium-transporting ATPase (P-type)